MRVRSSKAGATKSPAVTGKVVAFLGAQLPSGPAERGKVATRYQPRVSVNSGSGVSRWRCEQAREKCQFDNRAVIRMFEHACADSIHVTKYDTSAEGSRCPMCMIFRRAKPMS